MASKGRARPGRSALAGVERAVGREEGHLMAELDRILEDGEVVAARHIKEQQVRHVPASSRRPPACAASA